MVTLLHITIVWHNTALPHTDTDMHTQSVSFLFLFLFFKGFDFQNKQNLEKADSPCPKFCSIFCHTTLKKKKLMKSS